MKSDGSKAKGGRTKSLHIKLPVEHPVFSIPEGERSRMAREWMEQGRQVLTVMQEIKRDIANIKKVIDNHGQHDQNAENNNVGEKMRDAKNNAINPAVFLDL